MVALIDSIRGEWMAALLSIQNSAQNLRQRMRLAFIATFLAAIFTAGAASAQSDEFATVFDVRRSLAMEPGEKVFHDYYINAGSADGVKAGTYVTVVREIPVHDPVQNKQQGTLSVRVAYLQILHVEKNLAVARLAGELSNASRPVLEYEALMIGDKVDLKSQTSQVPKIDKGSTGGSQTQKSAASESIVASEPSAT